MPCLTPTTCGGFSRKKGPQEGCEKGAKRGAKRGLPVLPSPIDNFGAQKITVKPANLTCAKKLRGGCYRWFYAWPLLHKGVSLSKVIDFVINPIPLPMCTRGTYSFPHAGGRRFYSPRPTCHSFTLLLLKVCSARQGGPTPDTGGGSYKVDCLGTLALAGCKPFSSPKKTGL